LPPACVWPSPFLARRQREGAPPALSDGRHTVDLVWHVEALDGTILDSKRAADEPINPASVVKVGTTLWRSKP